MIERFRIYRSAFPMVTYRLVLAGQIMDGDSFMAPPSLDRDEVEMAFMGDVFRRVQRASSVGEQTSLHLPGDQVLRISSSTLLIIEDDPQEGEEIL